METNTRYIFSNEKTTTKTNAICPPNALPTLLSSCSLFVVLVALWLPNGELIFDTAPNPTPICLGFYSSVVESHFKQERQKQKTTTTILQKR